MFRYLTFIFCLLVPAISNSQTQELDSLKLIFPDSIQNQFKQFGLVSDDLKWIPKFDPITNKVNLLAFFCHSDSIQVEMKEKFNINKTTIPFSVFSFASDYFFGDFQFQQEGRLYKPNMFKSSEIILIGQFGQTRPDITLAGFIFLPDYFDLTKPITIYWKEQKIKCIFKNN